MTGVLGRCLGAQLQAASLGADVYRGAAAEVGVLAVDLTPAAVEDPVSSALPRRFDALQWHGDTFDLPVGAVQLARSQACEQQAFVFKRAYGLQFHIEIDAARATEWGDVPAYAQSLRELLGPDGLSTIVEQVRRKERTSTELARRLFAPARTHGRSRHAGRLAHVRPQPEGQPPGEGAEQARAR